MKLTKLAVAACLLLPVLLSANDDASEQAEEAAVPEAQVFTSEHEIRIDGERIKYTATAGTMLMNDAMLDLARNYQPAMASKLGGDRV